MSIEEKFKAYRESMEQQVEKLNKMKDMLKSKIAELKKENEDLKKQIEQLKKGGESIPSAEKDTKAVASDASIQAEEINKLKQQIEKKDEEIKLLKTKVEELSKAKVASTAATKGVAVTTASEANFDPKIIDARLNAIQSKLDKNFDSIFDKLNEITKAITTGKVATATVGSAKPSKVASPAISTQKQPPSPKTPAPSSAPSRSAQPKNDSMTEMFKKQILSQQRKSSQPEAKPEAPKIKQQPKIEKKEEKTEGGILWVDYPKDGVIKCPKCGKQNYQEMENKAQILSYIPKPKYGRKYYCKSCRIEWAFKM
ncbi:MAG: hypothetical protein ACTSRZ_10685 [Promethearchaeota archaeon]